jgi:putative oxidoreductase
MTRLKIVLMWVLQVLCGALFVLNGVAKFAAPSWARNFERWGYPPGAYMVVGIVEAAAGLALLVPRLSMYAALTLMVVMAGAAATHLRFGEMRRLSTPLVYLVLLGIIAWLRRPAGVGGGTVATTSPRA